MINLTPHAITVIGPKGPVTFPPSGKVARVEAIEEVIGQCPVTGAPVVRRTWGAVSGLPEGGEACLVSALVLGAVPGRAEVFAPDTGPTAVRQNGQIVAVMRLVAA